MKNFIRSFFAKKGKRVGEGGEEPSGPGTYENPQTPLFYITPKDAFTVANSFTGVNVFGSIGSGKSSSVGYTIAKNYLRVGYGGIVLVVKDTEVKWWKYLAAVTGRSQDLIVMKPRGRWKYNFLRAAAPWGSEGSVTLVNIFMQIADAQKAANGRSSNDEFFLAKFKQLMKSAIDIILIGGLDLTLRQIEDIIRTAPRSQSAVDSQYRLTDTITECQRRLGQLERELENNSEPRLAEATRQSISKVKAEMREAETKRSVCYTAAVNAVEKAKTSDNPAHRSDATTAFQFFMESFPNEADKQRSGYIGMWEGMSNELLTGELNQLFNTETTFDLTQTYEEGKIVLVALPIHKLGETGVIAQVLMKYMFQRVVEHRTDTGDNRARPVFLWADEAQEVFSRFDGVFQRTAREYRCATVYLSQIYNNYLQKLGGGEGSRASISVLLENMRFWFCGANLDPETNRHVQSRIGKARQLLFNESSGMSWGIFNGRPLPDFSTNHGQSESIIDIIQDSEFTMLATADAPPHQPEFIAVRTGGLFSNGKVFVKCRFQGHRIDPSWSEPIDLEPPDTRGGDGGRDFPSGSPIEPKRANQDMPACLPGDGRNVFADGDRRKERP